MSAKEVRVSIGGDILVAMAANDEFPVSNVHRLARTMQEYFDSEGFEDTLIELGYSWRPEQDYWVRHLQEIRDYLRKEKRLFLEYKRSTNEGTFRGNWEFVRKGDFETIIARERADIVTRTETYNDRTNDGHKRWKLEAPFIRPALIEADEREPAPSV